ncbi:hypothetical protein [uncultured Bartonella sp.]|uniref:hypothetical protein n=1 Tax=uncultured Bartonella sp. TaxID=104108 RepID=UPI0025DE86CF|nr:hypothetical protein [uncultured Bartonella sp.]
MSVNQVFMSFTGLLELDRNEQSFHWKTGNTKIPSAFKLRLLVDRTTYNFSGKKFALQFSHKGHNIAFFPAKTVLSHSFRQRARCRIWQFLETKLEDRLFQPKKT